MQLQLSPRTKQRIFNRKMARAGYAARIQRWEDRDECMLTHITRGISTRGGISIRARRYNVMGEFDSPVYNIRASRIIRDTARMLREWTDPVQRQRITDAARQSEMRAELKDKFRAMVNRNNFFGGR